MPRQAAGRRVVGGDGGQRPGGRLAIQFRLLDQVGVGLRASPRGTQLGVGGRRRGVPGQVTAVGAVGVGGGGNSPPGGPDLLIGQVRAGGQAEGLERVQGSSGSSGSEDVIQARRVRPRSGAGSWRGSGTRAAGPGAAGGGSKVSGEGLGRATWTKVAAPRWM